MRATLEQLKAMDAAELKRMWDIGTFPFDFATCGRCLSQHGGRYPCEMGAHGSLTAEARPLWDRIEDYGRSLPLVIEEFYAMRLFFDSLYPQAVEAPEEKTIAESAPSLVAQG